jgi:preprotein translocase subunit SecE
MRFRGVINPITYVREFWQETVVELKKCTWPTRSELTESTMVVVVSLLIMCFFVAAVDWLSQLVIRWVTVV